MSDDGRDIDRDLRGLQLLDPARGARPAAGREPAAQAMLGRILEATPDETGGEASPGKAGRIDGRHRWRRWALAGAAAAALAAGVLLLPPWGTPEHAFATWTPAPQDVPAGSVDDAGAQCSNRPAMDVLGQEVVIAEERGRMTFVVMSRSGHLNHCILVDGEKFLSGSGSTGSRGSSDELSPAQVRTVTVTGGHSPDGFYTAVIGRVGAEVVGVELHPRGEPLPTVTRLDDDPPEVDVPDMVTATVADGYFGAWWPGALTERLELTIHLVDGSVVADVPVYEHD